MKFVTREAGSSRQVIRRVATSLFCFCYLWEFGSFLCFFSFVVSLLCNALGHRGDIITLFLHYLSLCCSRAERLFE